MLVVNYIICVEWLVTTIFPTIFDLKTYYVSTYSVSRNTCVFYKNQCIDYRDVTIIDLIIVYRLCHQRKIIALSMHYPKSNLHQVTPLYLSITTHYMVPLAPSIHTGSLKCCSSQLTFLPTVIREWIASHLCRERAYDT